MKSVLGLFFWIFLITANSFSQNLLLKNGYIVDPASENITSSHLVIQDDVIIDVLKKAPEIFDGLGLLSTVLLLHTSRGRIISTPSLSAAIVRGRLLRFHRTHFGTVGFFNHRLSR